MAELVGRSGQPGAPEHTDFLKRSQHEDGYWDEPEEIVSYDPPFWMLPGQYANQVWLTSAISCKLKELGVEQQVDFEKAVAFLRP